MFKLFTSYLTPNAFIDALQETKRGITNKIITDATLKKEAHNFIDAQTIFGKMLANNFIELTKHSVDSYANCIFPKKEVTKAKVIQTE